MAYKFIKVDDKFDIRKNFWELNNQIKYIDPYKQLYDNDKSPDKSLSSLDMYSIYLYCDPSYSNKIYRLEEKSKRDAILAYHPKFNWDDELISKCILTYPEMCLTPAARMFVAAEKELAKRLEFMQNTPYERSQVVKDKNGAIVYVAGKPLITDSTVTLLETMQKNTAVINKQYDAIRKLFEEEQKGEIRIYGGGEETLMDEGGLIIPTDDDDD